MHCCCQCKKAFEPQHKANSNKFCSPQCYWASKRGGTPWNKGVKGVCKPNAGSFKKGMKPWHAGRKGVKAAPSTAFKRGHIPWHSGLVGFFHPAWKGDDIGYAGVHTWMGKTFGRPVYCEACNSRDQLEWANKTGNYRRIRSDWLMLCRSCHQRYDKSAVGRVIIYARVKVGDSFR